LKISEKYKYKTKVNKARHGGDSHVVPSTWESEIRRMSISQFQATWERKVPETPISIEKFECVGIHLSS
jgi:hypothetical protein